MSVSNPGFNPSGSVLVGEIKDAALAMEKIINTIEPGRRRSIALTHLETASMWAVKAAVVGDQE